MTELGYAAEGITPDPVQAAAAARRFGGRIRVHTTPLEHFEDSNRYDVVLFQESSQYIDSEALFPKLRALAVRGARIVVLDEFALQPVEKAGALHRLDRFLAAARSKGFELEEEIDVTLQAAPTIDYFLERIPRHRTAIETELGLEPARLDGLLQSGSGYREMYRTGVYGYRLLRFFAR